jgi:hypothetical protein
MRWTYPISSPAVRLRHSPRRISQTGQRDCKASITDSVGGPRIMQVGARLVF